MSRPPPPPPPAPPNPWSGRQVRARKPLISGDQWPHRLLHVDGQSLTSYVREGVNTYNNIEAPDYNVLSYTWGYFKDPDSVEPALPVNGVDWPIPSICKSHFTPATFEHAIRTAARGHKHCCTWIWVDIACIPQQHTDETEDSIRLRAEEIGRQVEIFKRAKEAFAWLSGLKTTLLTGKFGMPTTVMDLTQCVNTDSKIQTQSDVVEYLARLENVSSEYSRWMSIFLMHPWLQSLWTLQEMVLRPDAWLLFDDGMLTIYDGYSPWEFISVKNDIHALQALLQHNLKRVERKISKSFNLDDDVRHRMTRIEDLLNPLLDLQEFRGLDALNVEYPHTAYSIANRRRVSNLEDRIYGIVQTYGITCDPFPAGDDSQSRLEALQDDFGVKLVAKSPLLSQLFIHSDPDKKPRRSWLITPQCEVQDLFWQSFCESTRNVDNLFESLEVLDRSVNDEERDLVLSFRGKAWDFDTFVEPAAPESNVNEHVKNALFTPVRHDASYTYRGLMLDYHISKKVLGTLVDYFGSYAAQHKAVQALRRYCNGGTDAESCSETNLNTPKVLLLGSTSPPSLPLVNYVGLVVGRPGNQTSSNEEIQITSAGFEESVTERYWERLGLVRWTENLALLGEENVHSCFPESYDFHCDVR